MVFVRWQPFSEMQNLRRQMDRMFEELEQANSDLTKTWSPAIELQDTNDSLILRAEIPGVEGKDLDVHVTREAVSIAGETRQERKTDERGYFRSEFRYGKFQRVIPLPVHVKNDQVQAEFKNGILTLTLPKVEEVKNKVVKINLGDTKGAITGSESQETGDIWS
jgi:HSP20 family protein